MKNVYVDVYIKWFNSEISRLEIPPNGIKFYSQIRFEDEGNILPKWTAEVILRKWWRESLCYALEIYTQ